MEENKKQKTNKLSYEELEMAANQIAAQLDAVRKENINLKKQIQQINITNIYTELEFRFKVIKNSEHFSKQFVDFCVNSIEELMTPKDEEENTKE